MGWRKRGTFIRAVSVGHAVEVVHTLFQRTNQMVLDIVEVRLILGKQTAHYAAERRSEEEMMGKHLLTAYRVSREKSLPK